MIVNGNKMVVMMVMVLIVMWMVVMNNQVKQMTYLLPFADLHEILQFYFFPPNYKMALISFRQLLAQVSRVGYTCLVRVSGLFYQFWFLNQTSTAEDIYGRGTSASLASTYLKHFG